ncbi:MAG: dihydroxyacetone kinase subunit DhaL [Chloroflexi bacterium]|nr:dihydroxyacetone kinase subunit DhaL [Chloroflexota bacterium]MCL5275243.1 dihydroxyacetone kinase subunit DhaL [Chloroflexota bacterium]
MEPQTIHREDIVRWINDFAQVVAVNRDHLTELDAAIGDGDHGVNMDRGFRAVAAKLPSVGDKDIAQILKTTGMTLVSTVGGASGPLYGAFFLQEALSSAGKEELSLTDWIAMLEAALNGIIARGKAAIGDKTMLDALAPALQALKDAAIRNATLAEALTQSADAAQDGMQATIPLVARKGRASYLGERSAGHIDPGAASMYLLLKTAASTLASG